MKEKPIGAQRAESTASNSNTTTVITRVTTQIDEIIVVEINE